MHGPQVTKDGGTGIINMGSKAGIEPVPGQARFVARLTYAVAYVFPTLPRGVGLQATQRAVTWLVVVEVVTHESRRPGRRCPGDMVLMT